MSPAAKAADFLIYFADWQGVSVYDYNSQALVGQLAIEGANTLCSDKAGNIWVDASNRNGSQMLKYARGGTQPVAELFSYPPAGCAVDPKSGDLAVVTSGDPRGNQNLEIYSHAQGLPHTYSYAALRFWSYCAYDNQGNILIQGTVWNRHTGGYIAYAELPSGQDSLIPVNISTTDAEAAGVQWDGAYFLIGYNGDNVMHRYAVHDGTATEISQVHLAAGQSQLNGFWLHHNLLIADVVSGFSNYTVAGFPYPAGSPEENDFAPAIYYPYAITVTAKR
jgi:hypothetical protein